MSRRSRPPTAEQPERHRPRKRFGQHFLHDRSVIERILSAVFDDRRVKGIADDKQPMLEIGPGEGALTADLLTRARQLHVVEIDTDLAARLAERFGSNPGFHLHVGDVLRFDLRSVVTPPVRLRVVGNLPYNVSTPVLFALLESIEFIADMHFMLQREVVQRMAARPGSGDYGRLSVMLQSRCVVQKLFNVGPGAFRPPPKVESAVVRLLPREIPLIPAEQQTVFEILVREAFIQRRKQLANSLKRYLSPEQLDSTGIRPDRRPETLEIEEFARLTELVHRAGAILRT
ncbi:MAG: 16S rRNA (adenine(1518)-N(6)/adenine(1519)-N(6))-dimethyltransferase RsmA [Gammaproteobacteria bacterium]|nr:16S rRNA (adenine(1518)-N(6)/adenine(1519)-N(6))-dimethyltransferase RsmA [Gammaproteobacteria bacterium]